MFPARRPDLSARFVTLESGLTLRVVTSGPVTGRAVLLLHGWGASAYMWRDWFAPLAAAGFRVIAPDLPGHGLSDKPDQDSVYTRDALVDIICELIESEGLGQVDVVAQSMSGTIATAIALRDHSPVHRLVLVNPALFGRVRMERLFKLVSPPFIDAFLPRLVRRWVVERTHRMVYGDPSRLSQHDIDESWAPSQFPAHARAMRRLLHLFNWERVDAGVMVHRLAPLAKRIFVVLGTRDRLVLDARPYVSVLQSQLPELRVHEVLGGGHAVNEERPEELVPKVRAFLAEPE